MPDPSASEPSPSRTGTPARRQFALALLAAAALAITVSLAAGDASPVRAAEAPTGEAPVAITAAPPLTWGLKASWRTYTGTAEASGGASRTAGSSTAPYNLEWEFESGSYDAESQTTQLDYKGTVRWVSHPIAGSGYEPPPGEPDAFLLDVTFSDPRITISKESSVITAAVKSRELNGSKSGPIIDYGRIPLENLEVFGVTPTIEGTTTTWSAIPAALSREGATPFDGFYNAGVALDAVGFSYSGPGGAPDFSEHFAEPGQPKLKLLENKLFIDHSGCVGTRAECPPTAYNFGRGWVDQKDLITNFGQIVTVDGANYLQLEAFSLREMEPLGEPFLIPSAEAPGEGTVDAYDTNENRLLYGFGSATPRWVGFDATTDSYEVNAFSEPRLGEEGFIGRSGEQGLAWDEGLDLGWRISKGSGEWQLITYKEEADGEWERHEYPIPDTTLASGAKIAFESNWKLSEPRSATASDGSLIALGHLEAGEPSGTAPATSPAGFRLVLAFTAGGEIEAVKEVEALPLEVVNATEGRFKYLQTVANGQILMTQGGFEGEVGHCQIEGDGAVRCDPLVGVSANVEAVAYKPEFFAVDPEGGLVWYAGKTSGKVAAFGGGQFLGAELAGVRNPEGGPVVVGEHHTVYIQSNNGGPKETAGSKTWGWAKYELLGYTPTVTEQPQDESVTLGEGEASKDVTFSVAATAEPDPTIQWQEKAPGSPRFVDVDEATEPTLTVKAEPGMGGAEYRALFTNAAGTVASEAATLEVEYLPRINLQLKGQAVTEGADASFSVVAVGNPTPTVTWTRRNAEGLWVPIDPADENFRISQEGDTLTVPEANTAESGMKFRAVVANAVGTVHSDVVTLTVTPRVSIPAGGIAVSHASLDWLGNEEMQTAPPFGGSNYFSAGVSGGNEATYRSVEGDAVVWQASSTGSEALATYPTRADHVTDGGRQVARLYDGTGKVEPDGATEIRWDATFSVNFYGGLEPFTIADPELRVEPDGSGELTATLSGCSSSQADSSVCTPLTSSRRVAVATFSGATVEPGKELTIQPDYTGVVAPVPDPLPLGVFAQDTSAPGWGSWPASFVEFQFETGLDSYWYTSGGAADPDKPPLPFTVNLEGSAPPASEPKPEEKPSGAGGGGGAGGGQSTGSGGGSSPPGGSKATGKPAKVTLARSVRLDRKGAATVARLACAKGGTACETIVPARIAARIGGRRWLLSVAAPKKIKAGRTAAVKVTLPKGARRALGHHKVSLRLRIVVRSGKRATSRVAKVTIVGRG